MASGEVGSSFPSFPSGGVTSGETRYTVPPLVDMTETTTPLRSILPIMRRRAKKVLLAAQNLREIDYPRSPHDVDGFTLKEHLSLLQIGHGYT